MNFKKSYPSVLESEEKLLDDLSNSLETSGVDTETTQAVMMAVSEAFTNALIHGNKHDPSKDIKFELNINEVEVVADIIDQGTRGLENIAHRKPPEPLSENGRGINLIRHYADEAEFSSPEGGGLKVAMKFKRRQSLEKIDA